MTNIKNISVNGFKTLFKRDFPYLPVWVVNKAYFLNEVVYETLNFYISLDDNNLVQPSVDVANTDPSYIHKWALYNGNVDDYVSDEDIQRAFSEAMVNFNTEFFESDSMAEMAFYYLAAHYLVIDLNNAANSLTLGFGGLTQSKSVGSVSESYAIPQWILNDAILGPYAQTGYGRKYLSLIMPFLIGDIILVRGKTTYCDDF